MKRRIPSLDEFINESKFRLCESVSFDTIRKYFPDPSNPTTYIWDMISTLPSKTPLSKFCEDICKDLQIENEKDKKQCKTSIKNYIENMEVTRTLKSKIKLDESYKEDFDSFKILSTGKRSKNGKNIIIDVEMSFEKSEDVQLFIDNLLDNYTDDILSWAEDNNIIKDAADYSVGFDEKKISIKNNTINGPLVFYYAN